MSGTTLARLLARINEDDSPVQEKTAADVAPPSVPASDPTERMLETVRSFAATKVAGAPAESAAVTTLSTIAQKTAEAEDLALLKIAELSGAAMCDGFMARLAAYDQAVGTKTASADALEAAYRQGQEDLEKQAAAEYERGQQEVLAEVHKTASQLHYAGQESARNVLLALADQG